MKKKPIIYRHLTANTLQKRQEQIAIERLVNTRTRAELEGELPYLPTDRVQWEYHCRKLIKGELNRLKYLPMLIDVVQDQHPFKFFLWGRQWGKTTMLASDLAYAATTNYDYDQTYFNFKLDALRTFSNNKFRQDVFGTEPLSKYLKSLGNNIGATNKVETYTRSIIDMLLPGPKWENVQGKSNKRMVIDEGQDHNWENFQNARETQADTMGDIIIAGIGGYVDSDYYNLWKSTNQMKYIYKRGENYLGYENMSWRADLEYNSEGLVNGDYMIDIQDGKWIPDNPKNFARHGYHLSQTYNPRIPLTIQDAIEKYHVSPEWSIEYKLKDPNYTQIEFRRNVLAEFVEGELKPITTQDMLKLFDKTVSLTKAEDVDHKSGDVIIGMDLGGAMKTIIWIWQCIDDNAPIFKLLWVEKIETGDTREQERICIDIIDAYDPDFISTDSGGNDNLVQVIQKRYGTRSVRVKYKPRPEQPTPTTVEFEKQESELRYIIDKTFSINRIIDLIKHPYIEKGFKSNRIILPGADYEKIKWVVKQFVALEGEKNEIGNTGQQYIKYIHKDSEPDDALQACNYAFIGWDLWRKRSPGPITFSQFKTPDPFGGY
jgi:hypothetical protein